MSRYTWPRGPKRPSGRAARRRAYRAGMAPSAGPDATLGALLHRRAAHSLAPPDTAPQEAVAPGAGLAVPAVAPAGGKDLWLPIGPEGTLRGGADSDPRVAGRVRDLAVSPDGNRVYAATALGGLWYSPDTGQSWTPVGSWASTVDRATLAPSSMTLACGAVHVLFDPGNDPAGDQVWVGTGEPDPTGTPTDPGIPSGNQGGVGILHAAGPVAAVATAPASDPWQRQAQPAAGYPGLRGQGVFSIARDPAVADPAVTPRLVAATTAGLHTFDPAAAPGTEPWSLVTVAAWETAATLGAGGSATAMVTDVVWAGTPAGSRLWVSVAGGPANTAVRGLWRSDNGVAGPFAKVDLPGMTTAPQLAGLDRLGLAAAPSDGTVLYVLASRPLLWRVDGDTPARPVHGIPGQLYGSDPGNQQGEYDLAVAVDPADPARIMIGGASVMSPIDLGQVGAAAYRLTLHTPAPPAGTWHTDYAGGNAADARWIGAGVHPDVHRIRWLAPAVAGDPSTVVIGCDGGVFVSRSDGDLGSFVSRASGLAVTETGFLASHPGNDAIVLIGVQDNGIQLRIGESAWRRALLSGDGGGVAFDPAAPYQFVGQATEADWMNQDDGNINPTWRTGANATQRAEAGPTRMYSNAAVVLNGARTQLAIGTTRVWYSEHWGHTWLDTVANVFRTQWVTLPTGTDPRAGDAPDATTDVLPPGPLPPGTPGTDSAGIRALRWAGPDRLYALLPGAVYRLDRDPATHAWRRRQILLRVAGVGAAAPAAAGPAMPPHGALNDLAVHDPAAGPHGSFYLATSHPLEPVWFFDGTATWFPSGLGVLPPPAPVPPGSPDGVRAPGYSVVVDPDDTTVVYAGTTVGAWKGTLTLAAGVPSWTWISYNNGLPEAAVQDLEIVSYPLPQGGQVRLLRAALQARGVWEVELTTGPPPPAALTYLRVHPYDTRRSVPVAMADPMLPPPGTADRVWHLDWAGVRARDFRNAAGRPAAAPDGTASGEFSWHASPDVRVRPALGAPPLPAPAGADGSALPWAAHGPADRSALWALQTALHGLDPLVVPDGRWTAMFRRRLRALRSARGLSDTAVVDAALWNHPEVQANFWSDPWADGGPTEADLVERIVGIPTGRPGGPMNATVSPASVALPAGPAAIEVCVHRRALDDVAVGGVSVVVLRTELPADPATWAAMPVPDLPNLQVVMDIAPAGGEPLPPAVLLPAGWAAADQPLAIRRPARPAGTARPVVVTFRMDLTGAAPGSRWLLLAMVRAGANTLDLTAGATLSELVRRSPHVAARSFQVL